MCQRTPVDHTTWTTLVYRRAFCIVYFSISGWAFGALDRAPHGYWIDAGLAVSFRIAVIQKFNDLETRTQG